MSIINCNNPQKYGEGKYIVVFPEFGTIIAQISLESAKYLFWKYGVLLLLMFCFDWKSATHAISVLELGTTPLQSMLKWSMDGGLRFSQIHRTQTHVEQ